MSNKYIVCYDETGLESTGVIVSEDKIKKMLNSENFISLFGYTLEDGIESFNIDKRNNGDIVLIINYFDCIGEISSCKLLLEKITLDFS